MNISDKNETQTYGYWVHLFKNESIVYIANPVIRYVRIIYCLSGLYFKNQDRIYYLKYI